MTSLLLGLQSNGGKFSGWKKKLNNAWGISNKFMENLLRRKGQEYFTGVELTGSIEGADKNPKMSLLKQYRDHSIPDFQRKVVDRFNNDGEREVYMVLQEDGAGLHTDGTYLREKKKMFAEKD